MNGEISGSFFVSNALPVVLLAPWMVAVAVSGSVQARPLSPAQRINIAAFMGRESAALYCQGNDLKTAIEKSVIKTMLAQDLDPESMDQIDLDQKEIGIAFFENVFADAFANCPSRARQIWRQMTEM